MSAGATGRSTVVSDLKQAAETIGGTRTVCCVGVFDGVHIGHQRIIEGAVAEAQRRQCRSLVITFRNHPLSVLAPPYAPLLLTDVEDKIEQLEKLNPSVIASVTFDRALADLEPKFFLERVLCEQLYVVSIWCGKDFRFGREGRGGLLMLEQEGQRLGVEAHTIEPVVLGGHVVSSSWIRLLLDRGEIELATKCLGRRYRVRGKVVRGDGRGAQIGFPTANIAPPDGIALPADGIYAALVEAGGQVYGGMMHLGPLPTFGLNEQRIEVHLFDFHGCLLGQTVAVEFVARMRDVERFDSPDQLIAQMQDDEQRARAILKEM